DAVDIRYFAAGFSPQTLADAQRYRDIVNQVTRASREIAAIVAHHIGKAMGVPDEGTGPMANPANSGYLWPTLQGLAFATADVTTLQGNAVPHQLPGKNDPLIVTYFPLLSLQPALLPNLTTDANYSVAWNYVGGRATALPTDYTVAITGGT